MDPGSAASSVMFDCPTGNCTFQEQLGVTSSSIAYCSSCDDMTQSIEEVFYPDCDPYPVDDLSTCYNYHLSIPAQTISRINTSVDFSDSTGSRMSIGSFLDVDGTTSFSIIAFTLAGCQITYRPDSQPTANCSETPAHKMFPNLSSRTSIMAAKCYIFPCLRNYHAAVINGQLHETVLSTVRANGTNGRLSHNAAHPSKDIPVVKLPCIVDGELYDATNISTVPALPTRNFTDLWQDGKHLIAPWECTYFLSPSYGYAVAADIQRMLNGSCGASDYLQIPPAETICPEEGWTMAPLFGGGAATVDLLESLFENMTLAMSNRLRNTGAIIHDAKAYNDLLRGQNVTSPGTINGTAWETMVCTHVQWPWVAFPAALTAGTGVLLVSAIWKAVRDREHRPIWKASVLPLLFHGPPRREEVGADLQLLASTKGMERAADLMRVKLGKGAVDMSLVGLDESPASSRWGRVRRRQLREGQDVTRLDVDSLYEQES